MKYMKDKYLRYCTKSLHFYDLFLLQISLMYDDPVLFTFHCFCMYMY